MEVGLAAGVLTTLWAVLVGLTSGYIAGVGSELLSMFSNVFLVLPALPLVVILASYLPNSGSIGVILVITVTGWAWGARVLRAQTLSLRRRPHLLAAQGFGARTPYILKRHLLPELALLLAAGVVTAAGRGVLMLAGLAFLGLGNPTQVNWGSTMRAALNFQSLFFTDAWRWWLLPPAIAVAVVLLGLTLVGVGMDSYVNPQISRHAALDRVLADTKTGAA